MNEIEVYNQKGIPISKPFIFTTNGSLEFYANPQRVDIIETAPYDNRKKSFYFHLSKDEDLNYELHMRVNPSRFIRTIGTVTTIGNSVKQFFKSNQK